jgi:predicted outer membrane protein
VPLAYSTGGTWSQLPLGPFDCAYAATEFTDHQVTVAAFQAEATHGDDSRIRSFATAQLPTLQGHLAMAAASLTDLWCQP